MDRRSAAGSEPGAAVVACTAPRRHCPTKRSNASSASCATRSARQAQASRADLGSLQQVLLTQQRRRGAHAERTDRFVPHAAGHDAAADRGGAAPLERCPGRAVAALSDANERRQAECARPWKRSLHALQEGNEKKLEQMRATVDEKLHATLEQRLGESFKQVADRLEQVHQGLGEMQALARDVGALKRVLTNVKTRGMFGEVQLAGAARAGVHARAVRDQRRDRAGQQRSASSSRSACPAAAATARRCGCRSMPSSRARTTSACSTRRSAPTAAAAEVAGQGASKPRLRLEAKIDPREVPRAAAHHRLRDPVPADRGPVRRGAAPARPGRGAAARAPRHAGRADHAAGDADQPADGLSHAGAARSARAEVWEVLGAVKTEFDKFGDVLAQTSKKLRRGRATRSTRPRCARAQMTRSAARGRGAARDARAAAAARRARRRPTTRMRAGCLSPRRMPRARARRACCSR